MRQQDGMKIRFARQMMCDINQEPVAGYFLPRPAFGLSGNFPVQYRKPTSQMGDFLLKLRLWCFCKVDFIKMT